MDNKSLCWKCEKRIEGGLFNNFVSTSSGNASACNSCATYGYKHTGFCKLKFRDNILNIPVIKIVCLK